MSAINILQTTPPTPGPCPEEGCPPATEIVCIFVPKVYDFCFQADSLVVCTTIPAACGTIPAGATITCEVGTPTCVTGTPVPTGIGAFASLPVTVTVPSTITIRDAFGAVLCSFAGTPVTLTKSVIVCAPAGVTCDCEVSAVCGDCTFIAGQVCCTYGICIIVECTAPVKLLVPSFGFCVPGLCSPGGFPPGFICPPPELFPPQCTPSVV